MSEGNSVPASSAQPNISPLAKYKLVFLGLCVIHI